jgi:antitoxin component YwqK of YwqJK toxin-antitoxin module
MNNERREVRIEHYDTGTKKSEVPLENGAPHGTVRMWHPNGAIQFEVEYRDGKRHGTLRAWYESGQLESVRAYARGKKHGAFTDWHRNGVKAADGEYEDDRIVRMREWDERGDEVRSSR